MDDIPEKLRQYYGRQSLPAGAAERILALGREAGRERRRRRAFFWSMAAMLALAAGGFAYRQQVARSRVEAADVEIAMQAFFNRPDYQLARVSADLPELRSWLQREGGPAGAGLPAAFAGLPAYGCHVLQVREQSVYLLCFFLDPADSTSAPMMNKKAMVTVVNADGTMMKKTRPLVHFVAVPRAAFKDPPPAGAPVVLSARGDWEFAEWRRGDVVYIAGGTLPAERLRQLVAKL